MREHAFVRGKPISDGRSIIVVSHCPRDGGFALASQLKTRGAAGTRPIF
jgi:hypothetical protein